MEYKIEAKFRTGDDDNEREYNVLGDCGDFRSTIDFTVKSENGEPPTGIIVQRIEKSTNVNIYNDNGGGEETTLQTTQDIYDYTDGNVPFMNDNYLEIFNVVNGEVTYGDQFGNGPICKYDEHDVPIVDDELDMSTGEIQQTGKCVFILNTNPIHDQILKSMLPGDVNSAANGLLYLPISSSTDADALWQHILDYKNSEIYNHMVKLNWEYLNIIRQNRSKLYIDNFQVINIPGGGARKHTKRKKRRKRKKNTRKK